MKVEPHALEADLDGMGAEEGCNVSSGYAFRNRTLGGKVGEDCGFRVGMV